MKRFYQIVAFIFLLTAVENRAYSQCGLYAYSGYYGGPGSAAAVYGTTDNSFYWSPGTYFYFAVLAGGSYGINTCYFGYPTTVTVWDGSGSTIIAYNGGGGPYCSGSSAASLDFVPSFTGTAIPQLGIYGCYSGYATIYTSIHQNNNLAITSSAASMCSGQTRALTATPASVGSGSSTAGDYGTFTGTGVSGTTFTAPFVTAPIAYTITYTFGYISTTQNITVNPLPGTISGTFAVCQGSGTTLSTSGYSGTWTSSNTGVATINSSSGTMGGVSAGTAVISYTNSCGSATHTVTINPLPGTISGTFAVCQGSGTTLSTSGSGGTWLSSNTSVATINSSTGGMGGVSAGTATITYINICGSATHTVTINPLPGTISGTFTICQASATSLSTSGSGGTWTSSNTGVATISSSTGGMGGVSAGTATITYSNGCGSATHAVTINPLPGTISGTFTICQASGTSLSTSGSGGTWTSSNTGVATINSSTGGMGGVSAGTSIISYTNSCGSSTQMVTINPLPGTISGTFTICQASATSLSTSGSGGTWTSSNTGVATINSSTGGMGGVSAGTAIITYGNGCGSATHAVTINPLPGTISGTFTICQASGTSLSTSGSGGTWTSSNTGVATINSSTGGMGGVSAGTATITYANSCGSSTQMVTINPIPGSIGGTFTICQGNNTSLSNSLPGGTWSSSASGVATIDPSSGSMTGVTAGTATITYSNTCGYVTQAVTINATPDPPSGILSVCAGMTTSLSDAPLGGSWFSSNASVATVDVSTGVVSGVTAGTTNITYMLPTGCFGSAVVTVTGATAGTISGITTLNYGGTTVLADGVTGGTWSSSNTSIATVGTSGTVSGVLPGSAIISYAVTSSCGTAYATVTVNVVCGGGGASGIITTFAGNGFGGYSGDGGPATAASLSYPINTVSDGMGNLYEAEYGNGVVRKIDASGIITTIAGTGSLGYSGDGGPATAAQLASVVSIALDGSGNLFINDWSNHRIRKVDASGMISTIGGGIASGYSGDGGPATAAGLDDVIGIAVDASGNVYLGQRSYNVVRMINPAGIISTIAGNGTPSYSGDGGPATAAQCSYPCGVAAVGGNIYIADNGNNVVRMISASGTITTIAGNGSLGYSGDGGPATAATLSSPWDVDVDVSGNLYIADYGNNVIRQVSATGVINTFAGNHSSGYTGDGGPATAATMGLPYGVSVDGAGNVFIADLYNSAVRKVGGSGYTVAPITGTMSLCIGTTSALADATSGGTWSSTNTSVATVTTGGVTTGVSAGTSVISYTTPCGYAMTTVTVIPNPGTIAGTFAICDLSTTTLTNSSAGGTWTTSNSSIASIGSSSGFMTGVAAGTASITYGTGCGTAAMQTVTVNPLPGTISGTFSLCQGTTTTLSNSVAGGSWISGTTSVATIDPMSGMLSAVTAGTTTITYATGCGTPATQVVTVNGTPSPVTVSGAGTFCGSTTITASGGTGGTIYFQGVSSGGTATGTPSMSQLVTSSGTYYFRAQSGSGCWGMEGSVAVTINPATGTISGPSLLCTSTTATLTCTPSGGTWTRSNPAVATVGSASGSVYGIGAGTTTITYALSTGCKSFTTLTVVVPGTITGTLNANVGSTSTLTGTTSGGTWTSSNTSIATVGSGSGVVGGVAAGTTTITYAVTAGCNVTVTFTVNPTAGPVTGSTSLCGGTSTTLTNPTPGGIWSSSNTAVATIGSSSGMLYGVSGGYSIITYTVGTSMATTTITVTGAPVVTSLSVSAGYPTSSVTITGTGFNSNSSSNFVYFGATQAAVSSASATSLSVTVPMDATYMPVSVGTTDCNLAGWSQYPFLPTYDNSAYVGNSINFNSRVDFTAGTNPFSVAIGDIDGDGKSDMAAVNYGANTVSIYRNTSTSGAITSGSFATKVDFTTGSSPQFVAIGDIDGDGKLDVVVANDGASTVSVFRNTATSGSITSSSLASKVDFACGNGPIGLAIGDLDMDGKADITVANYGANTLSVLRNTSTSGTIGSGSFATKVDFATGVHPFSVAVGDIDGDGKSDVAVVNQGAASVSIFRNISSIGSFTTSSLAARVNFTTGTNPDGVAIGDIDGDGKMDVAVINNGSNTMSLFRNTASSGSITSSSLATKIDFTTGTGPYHLAMGDMNGDGKVDIAVVNTTANTISLFRNTATSGVINSSSLAAKIDFATAAGPRSVAIGDLDGDQMPDIAIANITAGTVSILRSNPLAQITGITTVCGPTATTMLSDATSGGVWSSSNALVATVGTSGTVTGVASGTTTISYTLSGQSATAVVTVGSSSSITGTMSTCEGGSMTTLSDATSGGAWSSSNTSVATVAGGVVTGVTAGTTVISYLVSGCTAMATVTVNPLPASISGTLSMCAGTNTALTDGTSGGTWSSSATSVATAGSTGIIYGVAGGTATITYALGTGCITTAVVTVNALPSAITGTASMCIGMSSTLTDAGGGMWTSSNTSVATVGSTTADVWGVAAGTSTITYTLSGGCFTTRVATVNPSPAAIGGTMSVCAGSTATLTDAGGGNWMSSNTSVATIGSSSGTYGGVTAGTSTITYALGTGCTVTTVITVNPLPGTISGPTSLCVFGSATLTDAGGGTWATSNAGVATIGSASGFIFGSSAGTALITYTLPTGCRTTTVFTITPPPASISGTLSLCNGTSTTLGDATGGGTWSSSDGTIATVGSGSGSVSGVAAGTATITYAVGSGCITTAVVTVNPSPAAITGTLSVCQGSTTPLASSPSGGLWTSTNTGAAAIGSVSGVVSGGAAPATSTISYTFAGCAATAVVTVNPMPVSITGSVTTICLGGSTTYSDGTSGGSWTSSNTGVATVGSGSGSIGGVAGGSATITYTLATGCYATKAVTVSTGPASISGATSICGSSTTTLTDATSGGTWSSSNTGVASVGSSSGAVVGLSNGTTIITYAIGCGISTTTVTVGGAPSITSVNTYSDTVLAVVTITGTSFNTTMASNIVYFGATQATVSAASGTSLTVAVPVDATFMPISVENTGCNLTAYTQYPFLPSYNNSAYINTTIVYSAKVDFTSGTNPFNVAIGDIDGDGKADLVATNYGSNTISVYRNTSTSGAITSGSFAAKVDFTTGASPYGLAIGDLDGDGKLDIAVANNASAPATVSVFRNTATSGTITSGSLAAQVTFSVSAGPISVAIADLDKDGRPDLAVANNGANTISLLRNTSTAGTISSASFATKVDFATALHPYYIAAGDIDGDGKPDLVIPNQGAASFSVFRNTASPGSLTSSSLAAKVDFTTASNPFCVALGDIDGDGKLDVVVANNGASSVSVFRNTATSGTVTSGSFAAKIDFTTGATPYSVALADINGDGKADIITANSTPNTVSVLRNTATSGTITSGSFAAKTDFTTGAAPRCVAVGDLDGDYKADIATANIGGNTVSILRNNPTLHPEAHGGTVGAPVTMCVGATVTLNSTPTGGEYSSDNSNVAVVDAVTGLVKGMSAGRTTVTYTSGDNLTITPVIVNTLPDAVYIAATPGTNIQKGQSVKLVAAIQNGGTNPVYQWLLNGKTIPGAVTATYVSNQFANNDVVTCVAGSSTGCSDFTISNSVTISVQAAGDNTVVLAGSDIRVTPNPNNGTFSIRGSLGVTVDQEVSLEITDMLGQVIYKATFAAKAGKINEQIQLNSGLANGMYILNLRSGAESKTFHFAKEQ